MRKNMVCIECPRGCSLTVDKINGDITVTGNLCPKGAAYARAEAIEPRRVVTSTVRGTNGMLSVKTARPVLKDKIFQVMTAIHSLTAVPPLRIGDVICSNIDGEGTPLIATKNYD